MYPRSPVGDIENNVTRKAAEQSSALQNKFYGCKFSR